MNGIFRKQAIVTLLTLLAAYAGAQTLPDGNKLLEEVDRIRFPERFVQKITILTVSPGNADKSMTIESSYKKGQGSYMEILDPPRSKGTRFLNREGSLWMYSPKSGSTRPIRLAPKDSFQGSAFSNSDVTKTTFGDEYSATVEAEEEADHPELGKVRAYRMLCTATTPEAPYGKIVMWLRTSDLIPLKFEYYAKSGLLYRTVTMSEYRQLAGRMRATHIEMESVDKAGTKSILTIQSMDEKKSIPDSLFNLNNLTR